MKLPAMLAPIAKAGVLFDMDRILDDFNLLNNAGSVFYQFKNTAAVGANIEGVFVKIIDLTQRKRRSIMFGVSQLGTYFTRSLICYFSRRFDYIRRWWLRRIGGILGEFSYLVGKFDYLFSKLGNLLSNAAIRSSRCLN